MLPGLDVTIRLAYIGLCNRNQQKVEYACGSRVCSSAIERVKVKVTLGLSADFILL